LPQDLERPRGGLTFVFTVTPAERSLARILLSGRSWPGASGKVLVSAGPGLPPHEIWFPIADTLAAHTIDLLFVPNLPNFETYIEMLFAPGMRTAIFKSISFGVARPLVNPVANV
jgi:hypothetical protein